MANVDDALKTKAFENATVIAGHEGLNNTVKSVTVAEVPDAADWLRGGEIVCTTGFFIRDNSVSQVQWIESLICHGASALAIKSTRFLGEISDTVKVLAESKRFPIINLPNNSTWPFVIESVMNLISDEQVEQLQRAEEIHTQLTQLVLDGNSVSSIAQSLADLVSNPIVVEDGRFNLIASSLPTSLNLINDADTLQKFVDKRTSKKFQDKLFHSDYYHDVLNGDAKKVLELPLSQSNSTKTITIPIIASNTIYGFLTLIEAERPYTSIDVVALEHGATTIALQLVKNLEQNENLREKEQEAIQSLIHGQLRTTSLEQTLPSVNLSSSMVAILIQSNLKPLDEKLFVINRPELVFKKILKKHIQREFGNCIIGYEKKLYTLLIPFRSNNMKTVFEQINRTMADCLSELQKNFSSLKIVIAIGGVYSSRNKLKKSYEDAKITLEIMEIVPSLGPIANFERIGIYRLLHMIKDEESLRSFRDDFLKPLITHDEKNSDLLCKTLYAYLQNGGNITATARHLFVHPNTITYRLRKIQSIIGDPMDSPQYRESLMLALEIDNYLS